MLLAVESFWREPVESRRWRRPAQPSLETAVGLGNRNRDTTWWLLLGRNYIPTAERGGVGRFELSLSNRHGRSEAAPTLLSGMILKQDGCREVSPVRAPGGGG